jgi:3-oxoacyl-[acyl-carrier protein] reductase
MTTGLLSDRTAIVTGAASGIGAGIAVAFSAEGARVALVDQVAESAAEPVLEQVRKVGSEPYFHQCNVASEAEVEAMTKAVLSLFGHVDILVNNAGIFTESSVADMPIADWDLVLGVNLRGTFLCTRFVLNHMLERGYGRIINMASQLGQIGGAEVAHYSASKGGVIAFTKALAREVSTKGVLVNAIAPGPIKTPMLDNETEEWRSRKLGELPIGRFGEVSEVTPTAILLASYGGSYYVGQTLGPNGGDVML